MLPLSFFNMYHLYLHLGTNKHIYILPILKLEITYTKRVAKSRNIHVYQVYILVVNRLGCEELGFESRSKTLKWGSLCQLCNIHRSIAEAKQHLLTQSLVTETIPQRTDQWTRKKDCVVIYLFSLHSSTEVIAKNLLSLSLHNTLSTHNIKQILARQALTIDKHTQNKRPSGI